MNDLRLCKLVRWDCVHCYRATVLRTYSSFKPDRSLESAFHYVRFYNLQHQYRRKPRNDDKKYERKTRKNQKEDSVFVCASEPF